MGDTTKIVDRNNKRPAASNERPVCQQCQDRKYHLVASKKLNQSTTVYERQLCRACADEENMPSESNHHRPPGSMKVLSGTGYLRNKKRRRKE